MPLRKLVRHLIPDGLPRLQFVDISIGFIHLTRMMATTFAEAKIRVNCIAPGIFPSEMTAGSSGDDQKSKLDMSMSNPAQRTGHDSDMAACILLLAGPGGLFLNGQVLYPDGGESAFELCLSIYLRLTMLMKYRQHLGAASGDVVTRKHLFLFSFFATSVQLSDLV